MSAILRSVGVAAVLAASALMGAGSAASGDSIQFKPLHGVSLHLGSKHAVGYFVPEKGVCQLTLVVGDELKEEEAPNQRSARFRAAVDAGMQVRFDTGEGTELHFGCAPGATAMTVETLRQVAYTARQP